MPPILEMTGITKRFPGVVALDNVSLSVGEAEIVALIGENGAGKSTLMKILGGVYIPDAGSIQVAGQEASIRGVRDAMRLGIGFVHQELNVVDNLDVAGNVYLGREPLKGGPLRILDRAKMNADTDVYLKRLGLNIAPDTPLARLSLAQRQMVEIAKALSQNARLVIMDEPTSSLTQSETDRLLEVASDLKASGVSVIYISHRLGEIERLCDRVVGLRDGKNAGELAKSEIVHDRMVSLMVGRDLAKAMRRTSGTDTAAAPYLVIDQLRTRRYPNREVTFTVGKGEIVGMAGLVGAGRSEVAQAIFGIDTALGGTISVDGVAARINSPQDAIARGIYLVPEDRRRSGLIVDLPIRTNITLPALNRFSIGGFVRRDAERKNAEEMSKQLRVKTPTVETPASSLSGGNQQKVVLAKWLAMGPKVLIFDEPTRGIDVGAKAEIYELMRNLADQGVAILMISSDLEEVLSQSDRVVVLHEGRVAGTLLHTEATEEAVMRLAVGRTEAAAPA